MTYLLRFGSPTFTVSSVVRDQHGRLKPRLEPWRAPPESIDPSMLLSRPYGWIPITVPFLHPSTQSCYLTHVSDHNSPSRFTKMPIILTDPTTKLLPFQKCEVVKQHPADISLNERRESRVTKSDCCGLLTLSPIPADFVNEPVGFTLIIIRSFSRAA